MKPIFLKGEKIFLSPLAKEDDIKQYIRWINDQEITRFMGSGNFPVDAGSLREYIEKYEQSKTGLLLGIFLIKESKHIGNITLHMIDWINRHGEVGIIIGDKNEWGKGYATEAIRLIINHAFNKLNLHKLCAGVIEGNNSSFKVFEKIGFKLEGTLRDHFYLEEKYLECYRLGILKNEYIKENI